MDQYFKKISSTNNISSWECKGLSNDVIKARDNTLAPEYIYTGKRMYVKFNRSCLKQDTMALSHKKIVNIYIVYALNSTLNYDEDITLENCLEQLN